MSTPPTQPPPPENDETILYITPRPQSDHYAIKLQLNHQDPGCGTRAEDCVCFHGAENAILCLVSAMPRSAEHLNQSIVGAQLHHYAERRARLTHPIEYNLRHKMFLQCGINPHFRIIKTVNGYVRWSGGYAVPSLFDSTLGQAESELRGDRASVEIYVEVDWWFLPVEEIEKSISDQNHMLAY